MPQRQHGGAQATLGHSGEPPAGVADRAGERLADVGHYITGQVALDVGPGCRADALRVGSRRTVDVGHHDDRRPSVVGSGERVGRAAQMAADHPVTRRARRAVQDLEHRKRTARVREIGRRQIEVRRTGVEPAGAGDGPDDYPTFARRMSDGSGRRTLALRMLDGSGDAPCSADVRRQRSRRPATGRGRAAGTRGQHGGSGNDKSHSPYRSGSPRPRCAVSGHLLRKTARRRPPGQYAVATAASAKGRCRAAGTASQRGSHRGLNFCLYERRLRDG